MFKALERINERPEQFQFYTASDLWTDEHTSKQMLSFHLNGSSDVASRNADFIHRSVEWIASEFNIGRDSKIADFGCGLGLYAGSLAKRGANVTGIRKELLSKFYRTLKPSGSVLLDVYSLAAFEQKEEISTYEVNQLNGFWSPNKYYGFLKLSNTMNKKLP